MKVGTDGVLLGAWARVGRQVLDIGCGSGLLCLMMAQRLPEASVTGIDIDHAAAEQAQENVAASPFASRISIKWQSLQDFAAAAHTHFDTIVCNPPFFSRSLTSPDQQRTLARHTTSLPLDVLFREAARLLTDDGVLNLVFPADRLADLQSEAAISGLFECRRCMVRTTPTKPPKRVLIAFSKQRPDALECSEGTLTDVAGARSQWLQELTSDFYL